MIKIKTDNHWRIIIICIVLFVMLTVPIGDYITRNNYNGTIIVKDREYTPAYISSSCNESNCISYVHSELCQVLLYGDNYNGWTNIDCSLYYSNILGVQWSTGGLIGIKWERVTFK